MASFLPLFVAVCLLVPSAFAQSSYQSGNFLVYPPPPYTYPSVTSKKTFAPLFLYFRGLLTPLSLTVAAFPQIGNYVAPGYSANVIVNGTSVPSNLGKARGQWSLTMYTRDNETSAWSTALNCTNPGYDACPWQQTMQSMGEGQIKVEYKWINPNKSWITMINSTSMVPTTLEFYVSFLQSYFVMQCNCGCLHLSSSYLLMLV